MELPVFWSESSLLNAPAMSVTEHNPPPPQWLVRLSLVSAVMAMLALGALLWSKWGLVVVITTDVLRYCF
jgi:hypothetical protein